jgi:preprotein translocase subunit YajC
MNNVIILWTDVAANQGPSPLFWPFMLMGLFVFYFFMIRPQQKEQKQQKLFSDSLKKGSKVITTGGLHGTIAELKDTEIQLLIAPKTVITLQKSSISLELTQSVYGNNSKDGGNLKEKSKSKQRNSDSKGFTNSVNGNNIKEKSKA